MRVAVVTQYFPSSNAPREGQTAFQTLRLLARLCPVRVFYPVATYPRVLAGFLKRQGALDPRWQPGEVDVAYIPYPALPVLSRPLNGWSMARALLPHIRPWAPEIVLSYIIYPNGYAAVRIAEALGVPSVLTAIGSDLNRIPDALCKRLTRSALRQADEVVTVSRDLCRTARGLGAHPERSRALLNGCDTALFRPADRSEARRALSLDPDAAIVLYVGRFDLRKGLFELVEALAQLTPARPNLRAYLIGDGPDRPAILEAIARHNLAGHLDLVPAQSSAAIARWMAAADLVTLPSYMEGCPNVVVEALSAGRPVVATNVGGIPELMDETCGALVPPRDAAALAAALTHTLNRAWDAAAISANRSRGWQDVVAELMPLMKQTRSRFTAGRNTAR